MLRRVSILVALALSAVITQPATANSAADAEITNLLRQQLEASRAYLEKVQNNFPELKIVIEKPYVEQYRPRDYSTDFKPFDWNTGYDALGGAQSRPSCMPYYPGCMK